MKLSRQAFVMTSTINTPFLNSRLIKFFAAFVYIISSLAMAIASPGSGGPDAFGYKWKDSDEAGGPSFNYIDISSSGTAVTLLADDNFDGPFPIGFTFNFYGSDYTEFYVASNGFIGFGPSTGYYKFTNVQPPVATSPNNIIAWLWDDLIPRDDSGVYYQSFADKLVIQFVQYGNNNSGAANERVNAEVILYPNGKILVQYLNFTANWPFNLCTVGLENADGTDGLTVVYNAPYLHDALAVQFSAGASAPAPPTLNSPANGATSQPTTLTLKWNASTDATSYRLQVATDNAFTAKVFDDSTLISTSKQIGPLLNNKTYFWRVKAKNDAGASAWSSVRNFTTEGPSAPPTPTLNSPANGATSQPTTLTLKWNPSAGATSYRLQVATDNAFTALVFDDSTLTGTSKQIGPLLNNKTYFWRVKAKNDAGASAWSSVRNFTTEGPSVPPTPTLNSPANGATSQPTTLTLKWNASTGATSYRLQVATDNAFTALVFDDSTLTGTSKQIGPLLNNKTYFWRVKAKNDAGASAWSSVRNFTTQVAPLAAPTLVTPVNSAASQATTLTLNWNASTGATTYHLQLAYDDTFIPQNGIFEDSTLTGTSRQIGPLANGQIYFWRVRAKNNGGTSTWSQIWKFTTEGAVPPSPVLISPADDATLPTTTVNLQWNVASGAATYRLQVATDTAFAGKIFDDSTITATSKPIGPLTNFQTYYWRVNAKNAEGTSAWSSRKFAIADLTQSGASISASTKSGFLKSNQSKVFYHDSQWWALACNEADSRWYIWRYNSGTTWVKTLVFTPGVAFNCDAVINPNNGKLYVFGSHKTTPFFWRFSYFAGTWKKDPGYPVTLADFTNDDQNNPVSLVRAKNGDWWIFRINKKILQARCSKDDGQTWSAVINVKSGLTTIIGTTDAVAFSSGGDNFVGVAYGERDTTGSKYGFLRHREGDPEATWTDESSSLTFFGTERALNNICLTTDGNDNLYLMTRNNNAGGSLPRNTLYKRNNTGVWQEFKINSNAQTNWKTPAIAIDKPNGRIYCFGVNASTSMAEYKTCQIGQEAQIDTASIQTLFSVANASFDNLSLPANIVTGISGLMVCGDNTTAGHIWFRYLPTGNPEPLTIGAVTVASNEVNANATYTIPLTLSSAGGLSANNGVLHFRFPGSTNVPDTMAASQVLVNGVPATKIVANNSTKQVRIITPVNLANNQSFSVVFNSSAGLLNSTLPGNGFALTAWTSAQPVQANSPNYSLVPATTTVTPTAVTLSTTDPGLPTDYTLAFNLGDHGRMLSGSSRFSVKFGDGTPVKHGALVGVTVNTVNAVASGDSIQHKMTITLPPTLALGNNAAVKLFLPGTAISNPLLGGTYALKVWTTVETKPIESNQYIITSATGQAISGTTKDFDRNNQSKMFYYDGKWWVTAQAKQDSKWYLWKFDGSAWTRTIQIYGASKPRPDCVLDPSINKAFILLPGTSTTYILRLNYAAGHWTIDSGYPYGTADFVQNAEMNLVRANNGHLWIFAIDNSTLLAKSSSNGGKDWSETITLKSNLNNTKGLTDAVKFSANGSNYVGVGYAENSATGSVYGFLRHKDSDPETAWTDETSAIPQFDGTVSDNHISMLAYNNNVLMIVKTNGGGPNTTNVGLLRRAPNGNWFQYPILLSQGWTRPALAVDQTHNQLYVFGTREQGVKVGEMKHVAFGDYAGLLAAPIDTIFANETDNFFDVSVAAHWVNGAMNLLVCNGNTTRDELWFNLINLNEVPKTASDERVAPTIVAEENFEGVQAYPNPFNPDTFFRFKVPRPSKVKLYIFNLSGQIVRTLVNGELPQGVHQKRWNGRSQNGYLVSSGVYLYHLQIGKKIWNGRIEMIK
jgi:FlgD Ig-like domain